MDISLSPVVERIARVLAAQRLSANAKGQQPSAAPDVDDAWPEYQDDAVAILKTLREPDTTMAEVGDAAIWERMILAALGETGPLKVGARETLQTGGDPFVEGR